MRVGIDISALQGYHRMRGIGEVARNIVMNLKDIKEPLTPVFYVYEHGQISAAKLFKQTLFDSLKYEVEYIKPHKLILHFRPGSKLNYPTKALSKLKTMLEYLNGSMKFKNANKLDAFLQLDQSEPLAKLRRHAKNYFIAYDLIPYVLESDYLKKYPTARRDGSSRRSALKGAIKREIYKTKASFSSHKADGIIAISDKTKKDFVRYLNIPQQKIKTILIGINEADITHEVTNKTKLSVDRYHYTSWGYITKKTTIDSQNFLLFVGGVDPRRKLEDLVTAFNHLKARGSSLKLILAGDIMLGPDAITTKVASDSLNASSYLDDIYFLGYIDDQTRNWLYTHATAFVFPSIYEGFGLPILEAMRRKTPVIAYGSDAVKEVAGDHILYASGPLGIAHSVNKIQTKRSQSNLNAAANYAKSFSWQTAVKAMFSYIK